MLEIRCYFFVALPCEARPLIDSFKLKKDLSFSAFTIYRNSDMILTVTGTGKASMAAGVAYTMALFPAQSLPVLLNIGIAGHRSHDLGTSFVIEKIIDQETGRRYYPQLVATPPCSTQAVVSVAQAQSDYTPNPNVLYEMEAAAFYETAVRFSSSELIQCIKIISDNKDNPITQIKPAKVSQWISDALPIIEKFCNQLSALASVITPFSTTSYKAIIAQLHFTNNEKIQLYGLLNKRAILMKSLTIDLVELPQSSAKEVLAFLRKELDKQEFGGF